MKYIGVALICILILFAFEPIIEFIVDWWQKKWKK